MIYTAEEKKRMDYLLATFWDYIQSNKRFDIVYSEKLGYIVMNIDKDEIQVLLQIKNFDELLKNMFNQISDDVLALNLVGYHDDIELFPEEMVEVRRRAEEILNTMTQDREYCLERLDYYLEHVND